MTARAAPILKDRTELVEQAARDACAWAEPEDDRHDDRCSPGAAILIIGVLSLALWAVIGALPAWWIWS